ncbi:ATP-binding protein [Nocardioides dongxiaopingii]|uniref:ATP-binding protein n=1 Tax=Nocardioides dongxiaopingii TaxID=2576036 RepID=UPI00148549AD|nr:ATP-binding protein [Nocardioides dongxiaopingii]
MTAPPATEALPDPYTPGQVPRVLAGRAVELGRIRDRLGRVASFGELAGPLLVFHAPRGLGKTSLLRTAEREAAAIGFASAWLACSRERPFLPELVRSVERALDRVDLRVESRRRWRDRLTSLSVELGVLGVSVGGEVDATGDRSPDAGAAPIGALEDLLHEAARAVRDRGGAGLVVFIDELHAASADDLATLLNAVQNLDGDRDDNPLTVVTAGLPVTPEAIIRAATFGERSAFVPLDVLSDDDARQLLVLPADALGVTWEAHALEAVVRRVGGHPYLLQLAGSCTWQALRPRAGSVVDEAAVDAGLPAAEVQLTAMHAARWGSATELERTFISAMASVGPGNVTRARIAAAMGVDSRSISVPRERLIEKGIIEPVGHGLVRFTMPGFDAWVRARGQD